MKTLSQFKRDIDIGVSVLCIKIEEGKFLPDDPAKYAPLEEVSLPEKLKKMRFVNYKDTTGIYLKSVDDESQSKGSFCGWPKASGLEYDGERFIITEKDGQGHAWQRRTYRIIK